MNILSLFDGMSCGHIALDRAGIKVDKYYASEIDEYAIKVAQKNYPETIQLGNIENWKDWKIEQPDIVIGGSPCQGFSNAGLGLNFEDPRSKLFFVYKDIVEYYKPKYFLLENVKMKKKEWEDVISSYMGVEPLKINSDRFVQQNRERLYWTNIDVDINCLPDRPDWNYKYYQWRRTYFRENKSGVCPTLTANMGTGGHNIPLHSKNINDRLSPEECEFLQTVPEGYTSGVSNTRRYHMLGNGWTVDVIAFILQFIDKDNVENNYKLNEIPYCNFVNSMI